MGSTSARCGVLLLFVVSCGAGCDDDESGNPTSPTSTTTTVVAETPKANVAIKVDRVEPELSPDPRKRFRLTWHIVLNETAGVGARINFIRQDIWNRDFDQSERSEIGGDRVAEICGTNVVSGRSEWKCRVPFDFNLDNFEGLLRLTVTLYDDFDHLIVLVFNVPLFERESSAVDRARSISGHQRPKPH